MTTTITFLLLKYKYAILVPIVFIEGPMVTLFCGVLWKIGLMNGLVAAMVATLTDLSGDIMWYYIGYHKGQKFIEKNGKFFNLTEERVKRGEEIFSNHGSKIIVFMKVSSGFGMIIPTLFAAGMYRMNFRKYMIMNAIGETIWTFGLVFIGYAFSSLYSQIENGFSKVGFILFVVIAVFFLLFNIKRLYTKYVNPS